VCYRFRKTLAVEAICYKFINKTIYKAHQDFSDSSLMLRDEVKKRGRVREGLKAKCRICNRPDLIDAVNLGFIDRLRWKIPETDEFTRGQSPSEEIIEDKYVSDGIYSIRKTNRLKLQDLFKKDVQKAMLKEEKLNKLRPAMRFYISIGDLERSLAWYHLMKIASQDITDRLPRVKKEQLVFHNTLEIWFYAGRIHKRDKIKYRDIEEKNFLDINEMNYVVPTIMADTALAYSLIMDFNW
jgi:hypothetical protein